MQFYAVLAFALASTALATPLEQTKRFPESACNQYYDTEQDCFNACSELFCENGTNGANYCWCPDIN